MTTAEPFHGFMFLIRLIECGPLARRHAPLKTKVPDTAGIAAFVHLYSTPLETLLRLQ